MTFDAGGTIVFSYTDGTDRWELRVPCADFDPTTFAYTGTGLKIPTEADIAATVANFGGVWAPYFDPTWTLTLEALYHQSGGVGTRLGSLPSVADVSGTSSTPSSANPPLMRGFLFALGNRKRQVVRFFSVATTTTGARREVTATSGGFDGRDQALMAYLAGPSTGLVAWDGQILPPTATAYQRFKLAPFERGGGGGGSTPPSDCITFPRGATICNDAADVVHMRTPGATHALDLTGYQLPHLHRLEERVLNQTPNPPDPPVLGTTHAFSNPWPAGTYRLGYTYLATDGETALSPTASITVDGTQWIRLTTGRPPSDIGPNFLGAINLYVVAPLPTGAVDVYTGYISGAVVDTTCNVSNDTDPHASQPPPANQTGTWQVRVVDPHGAALLDLPLPILDATPPTLVGQDPGSGLPAFCPTLVPTTTTVILGGGGGSLAAPPSTCVQMRCGVSAALSAHLVSLYVDWSNWLDPLFQACASLGVVAALASVPWDWVLDLAGMDAGLAIKGGIITLLQGFGLAITGNLLPTLSGDLQTQIQQAAFDTLDCEGDQVQVSAANIAAWQTALGAFTTWPLASLAGPFCSLLLQYTPLAPWQAAAVTASPSHACDAWP